VYWDGSNWQLSKAGRDIVNPSGASAPTSGASGSNQLPGAIQQALLTLNKKNSSGVLNNSVYQPLVNSNYIAFNKATNSWIATPLGESLLQSAPYRQPSAARLTQVLDTLRLKNTSGVLPPTSNYQNYVNNGLIAYDSINKQWIPTATGQQLLSGMAPSVSSLLVYASPAQLNNAVAVLNKKNASGVLPPTSNYQKYLQSGLIAFDSSTNSWSLTPAGMATVDPYYTGYMYADASKSTTPFKKPTAQRLEQVLATLAQKNKSGVLPETSNYIPFVVNGIITFDSVNRKWVPTPAGLEILGPATIYSNPIGKVPAKATSSQLANAVSTLKEKNTSGVLPPDSDYQPYVL
jgi:hypothetical protein